MTPSPAIEKSALCFALYTGDQKGVAEYIAKNPRCLHGIPLNPYLYLVNSANFRKENEKEAMTLIQLIHPHTTFSQRQEGLRLIAEKSNQLSWFDLGMWALGEGAKLSNRLGDMVLSYIWAKPNEFQFSMVSQWKDSEHLEKSQLAHKALFTLVLAGLPPQRLNSHLDSLGNAFSVEMLKEAATQLIRIMASDRYMRLESSSRLQPRSIIWLDQTMQGQLKSAIENTPQS